MKVGIADYGLNQWYGDLYDYQSRLLMLKELGYEGIERLEAKNQAEAIEIAADARKLGMDFGLCRGNTARETLRWSAALGKKYVWTESRSNDFEVFCRQVNEQIKIASQYKIKVGLHNHLGTAVETQPQLEKFIEKCPECGLVLDVGHLAAAGGNPVEIIEKYHEKLVAVHLKDFVYKDKTEEYWQARLRFCELGAGEMNELNGDIITALKNVGYSGWIYVEHDTHINDPRIDLKKSREFMRRYGI